MPEVPSICTSPRGDARASRGARPKGRERRAHLLDHGVIGRARDLAAAIAVGERDDADAAATAKSSTRGGQPSVARHRASQTSSVEPPPISKTTACGSWRSSSGAQPATTSRASSSLRDDLDVDARSRPARGRGTRRNWRRGGRPRSRHSAPGVTLRCAILPAQIRSAAIVRAIAASDSTPLAASPSPSRTMREKASTTRKPLARGRRATSSRQLLVPRSSAA